MGREHNLNIRLPTGTCTPGEDEVGVWDTFPQENLPTGKQMGNFI